MPTPIEDLDDDQTLKLERHLQAALAVVGLDYHYLDGLLDAVDAAVDVAQEV